MDDMFDVFDNESNGDRDRSRANKKRLANGQTKPDEKPPVDGAGDANNGDGPDMKRQKRGSSEEEEGEEDEDDEQPAPDAPRQQRRDTEPEPIVADAWEKEEVREVTASAGLQAQKEGTNVVLSHQVRHQVALPPDYSYTPLSQHKPPAEPARSWPFTLDPFQQVAVASIERNESVLVSAHTSAGKTVCAEYAIAQCLKNNQRVIYTSPIKALSNQKYREFNQEFGDVGLMTGDVTINPTATCLVMTTEILRSMLYRGSEIMREVGWVIFDEVHYLRDPSRGVVWEETIILLPDKVRYVFLSATIPNAMQFAEWIVKTHNQPCHVVYTDFRPTPLQHYLFPAGADGIHLVVDEKGVFREENFAKAMANIADARGDDPADPNARRKGKGKDKRLNKGKQANSDIYKIVKMIMQKSYNPVIVFSFSKRECEAYALQMSSLTFNDEDEKAMVSKVFENALDMLSPDDRQLPQIEHILPLLKRGIGIHHSGLLPILKETIEILFQEGLIKVLFATETFSIGLNMPAKTVVFTSVRKFDGKSVRWVTPSEFIQMSGRAGRRGLDERGIVIMMIDERMEPAVGQEIVRGQQDNLNSAFHLGYNMILNLMRVEGISPEFMLERCFKQFQSTASVSGLEKEMHQLEDERAAMQIEDEATIKEYFDIRNNLNQQVADMKAVMTHPNYSLPFLQPGRLIHVKYEGQDFGWAVVVNYRKSGGNVHSKKPQEQYVVHALVRVAAARSDWTPAVEGEASKMEIVPMTLNCIEQIGHLRVFLPKDVKSEDSKRNVLQALNEIRRRFPDGVAGLDPVENMNIVDQSFKKLVRKIEVRESRLFANPLHNSPRMPELYEKYSRKAELGDRVKAIRKQINEALSIMQLEELKNRKRVLRRLGFINESDVVQLKARVACEISTGNELVLSELLFDRFFNELSAEHCAALLSCFVFEEKAQESKNGLRSDLEKPFRAIQAQARNVAKVSQESKMEVNEEEFVKSFKPEIMEVVFSWAKGASFAEIAKMTDVYEGNLIRVFRRLEELLQQMAAAAKVMGSDDLEKKFELTLGKIRRDIVAAQSLYL